MSNKEILEKAIQKAIDGGYDMDGLIAPMHPGIYEFSAPINTVIFNHDFAKALWGDELYIDNSLAVLPTKTNRALSIIHTKNGAGVDGDVDYKSAPAWQYHLQNMVIADDPIKYLGENI